MKRKVAALLTLALMITMLAGCGGSSKSENANDSSSGIFNENTSSKSNTLSDYLSKEKVIAYEVDTVDKSETPDNIYFFQDGKLTIIPGREFGLTMGDFAKMTDKEIWKEYKNVKEAYKETYLTDTKMDDLDRYLLKAFCEQENSTYANISSYEELQLAPVILEAVRGKTYAEVAGIEPVEVTGSDALNWGDSLAYTAEVCLTSYWNFSSGDYGEEVRFWDKSDWKKEDGTITFSGDFFEDAITHYKNAIKTIEKLKADIGYHGPFFDMPFSFVIETDATGNKVANEKLVYPTLEDKLGSAPTTYYQCIKFANVEGADRQIYDTTYNCFGLGSGGSIFCTRDSMTLDTVDSKKVLIDLSTDEINELFKEEVTARYE